MKPKLKFANPVNNYENINSPPPPSNKKDPKSNLDILTLVGKKMEFFQDIIQKTILYVQQNKILNILAVSEVNNCINTLSSLSKQISEPIHLSQIDNTINTLQIINNELSSLFKIFGTNSFEDLLFVCFGSNANDCFVKSESDTLKFELLKKYFHPISYKVNTKSSEIDAIKQNMTCSDLYSTAKSFHVKVHGIQVIIYNYSNKKSIIVNGVMDNVMIKLMNNKFIDAINTNIHSNLPNEPDFKLDTFSKLLKSLMLKDYLIYDHQGIYSKYTGLLSNIRSINQKTISNVVKEFIGSNLYIKRNMIMMLLINSDKSDNQYLAYLLYDLLTNDQNGNVDTQEQIMLFDSFPHEIKQFFKDAMKKTIQYTNDLSDFDINKIPIEQQICLLNASDSVKEKAMQKLKEVKSKSEDSCSKARQYLDALLKIPFNIYRKEPILYMMDLIKNDFRKIVNTYDPSYVYNEKLTNIEMIKYLNKCGETKTVTHYKNILCKGSKSDKINTIIKINGLNSDKKQVDIKYKSKTVSQLDESLDTFIDECFKTNNVQLLDKLVVPNTENTDIVVNTENTEVKTIIPKEKIDEICVKYKTITDYTFNIKNTLDDAVYGHDNAKKQIERIIGQWINGEQDGYCFGFEGPPGVGKTSLAKRGLSNCLKDDDGISRPFAMIQMGGDSNGSSLHGHNYTYVGSTWGNIVQIIIDKKCMNPIIFIDEVDKISKTEHGKEIIGILTHLLDPAQNDCFQDKYFSGIDLNLSKALFILSYNDADEIDSILLDRIHRIKFDSLSVEDKLVVSKNHILPDIFKKMGLEDVIEFSDKVLKYIIENYTCESGARKLKEVLFEIIAEINLDILKNMMHTIPIVITIDDIKDKYLKDRPQIKDMQIHREDKVGVMNGLWANSLGQGGIIPIQSCFFYSSDLFELKLTGMQGDVMQESMNVALTLAIKLTDNSVIAKYSASTVNKYGIHIHCPEGATPKDGPSAGGCITTVIYSLLNNKLIKHKLAITGEINLQGNITEIGGLHLKFLGALNAGVKEFIYPEENHKDYLSFMKKYKNNELLNGVVFHKVSTIEEVFKLAFV
jgi:ATP-dependent Lon protease